MSFEPITFVECFYHLIFILAYIFSTILPCLLGNRVELSHSGVLLDAVSSYPHSVIIFSMSQYLHSSKLAENFRKFFVCPARIVM